MEKHLNMLFGFFCSYSFVIVFLEFCFCVCSGFVFMIFVFRDLFCFFCLNFDFYEKIPSKRQKHCSACSFELFFVFRVVFRALFFHLFFVVLLIVNVMGPKKKADIFEYLTVRT